MLAVKIDVACELGDVTYSEVERCLYKQRGVEKMCSEVVRMLYNKGVWRIHESRGVPSKNGHRPYAPMPLPTPIMPTP